MEPQHGTQLVHGAVYEFHKPDPGQRIQVEIVFMHGLQVNEADLKHAYYKTWRTADGKDVWPETWLKERYPNARILSLAYDSSARKTKAAGNMSPYLLGESLLDQMVSTAANIGQNDCPVVFVCHSLGGLIAKEIVVRCRNSDRTNAKYENLLHNMKAVFFYATPHGGSDLADSWISKIANWFPFIEKSSLVEYLKPKGTDRTHTQRDFLQAVNKDCKFYVVAEGRKSKISGISKWIVHENSASFPGPHEFVMHKDANHMTVCKPQSRNDTGYLKLTNCIDKVIGEYTRRITVDLSVDPIGIGGKIDEVSSLLERPEVSMVFLFGMGGAGKTTLSKAFYNRKAFKYEKSCYLENVKSKKVQNVQKELLRGLYGEKLDQSAGVEKRHLDMIQDCLLKQKVLVLVDDVSSVEHLEKLQVFDALRSGSQSKVVVTGRDKAVLPKKHVNLGKVVIVPVDGITEGSDLELFLLYAFEAVDPGDREEVNNELLGEAKRIVQRCNRLPLSLEVLGRYLGNSRDEGEDLQQWKKTWVEAYNRLQKAQNIDGEKLWSSLRISYDHLEPDEKKMLLDFACMFSEMKSRKILVERIWDSPIGVKNLINKSLLKVQGDYFVMHDQLCDMGRYMLLKEALKDCQYPIYLFQGFTNHLSETYMNFKELTTELGVPYIASLEQEVGKSSLQYSKLRFFIVWGCDTPSLVDDCLSQCFGDLKWLHLAYSGVTRIGIQKLCSFGGLRVLEIIGCDIVELPEAIGRLTNLLELRVTQCWNLQRLPNSIGKLKNLKRLVIEGCALRVVPNSIGDLSEVEELSFRVYQLKVIHSSQICTQKLVKLSLSVMPTASLRPFPQLQKLSIFNKDKSVTEFPQDFFKMDMPKLEVVKWRSRHPGLLKNRDGSQLNLEGSFRVHRFEVQRHTDGSIMRLRNITQGIEISFF